MKMRKLKTVAVVMIGLSALSAQAFERVLHDEATGAKCPNLEGLYSSLAANPKARMVTDVGKVEGLEKLHGRDKAAILSTFLAVSYLFEVPNYNQNEPRKPPIREMIPVVEQKGCQELAFELPYGLNIDEKYKIRYKIVQSNERDLVIEPMLDLNAMVQMYGEAGKKKYQEWHAEAAPQMHRTIKVYPDRIEDINKPYSPKSAVLGSMFPCGSDVSDVELTKVQTWTTDGSEPKGIGTSEILPLIKDLSSSMLGTLYNHSKHYQCEKASGRSIKPAGNKHGGSGTGNLPDAGDSGSDAFGTLSIENPDGGRGF